MALKSFMYCSWWDKKHWLYPKPSDLHILSVLTRTKATLFYFNLKPNTRTHRDLIHCLSWNLIIARLVFGSKPWHAHNQRPEEEVEWFVELQQVEDEQGECDEELYTCGCDVGWPGRHRETHKGHEQHHLSSDEEIKNHTAAYSQHSTHVQQIIIARSN